MPKEQTTNQTVLAKGRWSAKGQPQNLHRPQGDKREGMSEFSGHALFIETFKARAEFFKKGSIIPQRILKGGRKKKHVVKFGSDCWAIPTPLGYLVAVDYTNGGSVVIVSQVTKNLHLFGSPYGGSTHWYGNHLLTDSEWSARLEAEYCRRFPAFLP